MNVLDRFRLDGKRLLVTGGSRGFGRVIALAAAEAGADIILNARDAVALAKTAGEVRERGRQVWTFPADIAEPSACEDFCKRVLAEAGPIDILVNNVGGRNLDVAIENTDLATWQRFVDLNLTHNFICTKMIGGAMLARGQGRRHPFHPGHGRRLGTARRDRERHLPGPLHDRAEPDLGQ